MIQDNIDILLVSETKLDDTFPVGQFYIDGYATPYLFDRTSHDDGILLYIRENIHPKVLKFEPVQNSFEGFFIEINLLKKRLLLSCSYNPTRKNIVNQVKNINIGLDQFSATYDKLILLGDFNFEPEKVNMLDFLKIYNWKILWNKKRAIRTLKILHA